MTQAIKLLDALQTGCASACDQFKALAELFGVEIETTVVISLPGKVDSAFVVGDHSLEALAAINLRLSTGGRTENDVTSTSIGETDTVVPASVQ